MKTSTRFRVAVAFFALLISAEPALAAVGKVVFAIGETAAIGADGTRRDLKRGGDIEAGDTLRTLQGRMQVRFEDTSFVSLQPRTDFVVDQFEYDGKEDGSESAFYRLLRGGIRAITGRVGARNKDRFKITTPMATIGIRGTAFTLLLCQASSCTSPLGVILPDGLYTKTGDGIIYAENNAGFVDLPFGAAGFVPDIDTLPIETSQLPVTTAATIEPAVESVTEEGDATFLAGDQRGSGGGQETIIGDTNVSII